MTQLNGMNVLPAELDDRLRSIRRRSRRTRLVEGLVATFTVCLVAMMIAMLIDELAVLLNVGWRTGLTLLALAVVVAVLVAKCLRPLVLKRPLSFVARSVEESVPALEERWSTVSELAENEDPPQMRGSAAFINRVAQEAISLSPRVDEKAVVSRDLIRAWSIGLAATLSLLVIILLANPGRVGVLMSRFWMPWAPITQTRILSFTGDQVVARGEPVMLEARIDGRLRRTASLIVRYHGQDEQNVRIGAVAGTRDRFAYALRTARDSFSYRWQCGDARSRWTSVRVEDRPMITQARLRISPPAYTGLPVAQHDQLPPQVRALRGSRCRVEFLASKPLSRMEVVLGKEQVLPLSAGEASWYRWETDLSESVLLTTRLVDQHGLAGVTQSSCRLIVYADEPPTVEIVSPKEEIAVQPDESIDIEFTAKDDMGIAAAELVVTKEDGQRGTTETDVIPIPLGDAQGAKDVDGHAQLDLKQLNLQHGDAVSYAVRVYDTRSVQALSQAAGSPSTQPTGLAQAPQNAGSPTGQADTGQTTQPEGQAPQQMASQQSGQSAGMQQGSSTQPALAQAGQPGGQQSQQTPGQQSGQSAGMQQGSSTQPALAQAGQPGGQQSQQTPGQQSGQSAGMPQGSSTQPALAQAGQAGGQQSQQTPGQQSGQSAGTPQGSSTQPALAQAGQPGGQQSQQAAGQQSGQSAGAPQSSSSASHVARVQSAQGNSQSKSGGENQPPSSQPSDATAQASQGGQTPSGGSAQKSDGESGGSLQPPPDNMTRRSLDVPQGSVSSKTQRIQVDEWAGSFKGQARKKREVAINGCLERVRENLVEAGKLTEGLLSHVKKGAGWGEDQAQQTTQAGGKLQDADKAIAELKVRSANTPYAFVGLQFVDLSEVHIKPAREAIRTVGEDTDKPSSRQEPLETAARHIARALQLLEDLVRQYEDAKNEQRKAETLQRLAKMHQAFVEDVYALLNACKPLLNPRAGQWQIIPDEIAKMIIEAIEKNAEMNKELMAALAKILAEDPDLLSRFMANMRKSAMTLRDQLTVLARRQKALSGRVQPWTGKTKPDREGLKKQHQQALADENKELTGLAAQLCDDVKTWVPRDLKTGVDKVTRCQETAARLAKAAGQSVQTDSSRGLAEQIQSAEAVVRELNDLMVGMIELQAADESSSSLAAYTTRRSNQASDLLLREDEWIRKAQALLEGRFERIEAIDQGRLTRETRLFGSKMKHAADKLARMTPEIGARARILAGTISDDIVSFQDAAGQALEKPEWAEARNRDEEAGAAFARAEKQYDELLDLVEEYLAKGSVGPPPRNRPLEQELAELLEKISREWQAREELGEVIHRNLIVQGDMMQPGQSGSGGVGQGNLGQASANAPANQAQQTQNPERRPDQQQGGKLPELRAAIAQAFARVAEAQLAQEEASKFHAEQAAANKKLAVITELFKSRRPGKMALSGDGPGGRVNDRDFVIFVSRLDEGLRQARGNQPPEQYRETIDAYFREIAEAAAASRPSAAAGE